VLDKARTACANTGQAEVDHFAEISKMIDLGKGAQREVVDVELTRYTCYLIAQNGDRKKDAIAFAPTYFAVQTRKQEIIEARIAQWERLRRSTHGRVFEALMSVHVPGGQAMEKHRMRNLHPGTADPMTGRPQGAIKGAAQ
jgi:hypothetical protein